MRTYLRLRSFQPLALALLCSCGSNLFQSDPKCGLEDSIVRDLAVENANDIFTWGEGRSAIGWSVKVEDVCPGDPPALEWMLTTEPPSSVEVEAWVSYGIRILTIAATLTEAEDSVVYDAVHTLEMKDQYDGSGPAKFTMGLTVVFENQGTRAADSLFMESILHSGTLAAVYRHPLR